MKHKWNRRQVKCQLIQYKRASVSYNVSPTPLERRLQKSQQKGMSPKRALKKKKLNCYETVFIAAQEAQFERYINLMEENLFGIKLTGVRRLAYELSAKNNILNLFNTKKQIADND